MSGRCARRTGDLDVPGCRLYVRRAIRKHRIGTPKTGKARVVSVPPSTMAVLRDWFETIRAEAAVQGREALWFFPGATGQPIEDKAVRRAFTRCLTAAGITRRVRLHDLRHTVGSLAVQQGVPLLTVSRQLGHDRIGTTADIYAQLAPRRNPRGRGSLGGDHRAGPAPAGGRNPQPPRNCRAGRPRWSS